MTEDDTDWPRACPLSQEQLRRAYAYQSTFADRLVARIARTRLALLPDEREPPIEETE